MQPKNQGLTVGELTISIAVLLLVFFIWSNLSKRQSFHPNSNNQSYSNLLVNPAGDSFFALN